MKYGRHKMGRKQSRRSFTKGATNIKGLNYKSGGPNMRGGIRL